MADISGLRETIESVLRLVGTENKISSFLCNIIPFHLCQPKKKNKCNTPRINTRQCELLPKKASRVLHVLEELKNAFLHQEPIEEVPLSTHDWTPLAVLELHRVLKDAEILIKECCRCDGQCLKVAIKRGNLKETFAKLLYDMEWHTSVLCNCALITRFDGHGVFDRSACEGKLGISEDFMLSSAVKQDRQTLRELIRDSHVRDPATSTLGIAADEQSRLALKFLEKLDAEEEELNRTALLSESQPTLFLWVLSTDLKLGQLIGKGGFGEVHEATWLGQRFAIKTMDDGPAARELFKQEIAAMAGLDHPHVVRVVCCSEDNGKLRIVMELMYKSLRDVLNIFKSDIHAGGTTTLFPIIPFVDLMLQIAEGVRYLHSQGLAHRDLKSLNILLQFADPQAIIRDSSGTVPKFTNTTVNPFIAKVADFGLTKTKHEITSHQTLNVGTLAWMAPELFQLPDGALMEPSPRFRPLKMDAYSFGMVCYEILSGELPFADIRNRGQEFKDRVISGERPTLPKDTPSRLAVLIQRCWDGDSRRRPDFPTICTELRYIKGLLLQGNNQALEQSTTIANGPVFDLQDVKVQGPWGGDGGGRFCDGLATSIRGMTVKYGPGPCISFLEIEYIDVNGPYTFRHGDSNFQGSSTESIHFQPNEYITQIEGWIGIVEMPDHHTDRVRGLKSLTIHTNVKPYGPFGGEGETFGKDRSKFKSDYGRVVGFYGRSATVIDQIGCFIAPADG